MSLLLSMHVMLMMKTENHFWSVQKNILNSLVKSFKQNNNTLFAHLNSAQCNIEKVRVAYNTKEHFHGKVYYSITHLDDLKYIPSLYYLLHNNVFNVFILNSLKTCHRSCLIKTNVCLYVANYHRNTLFLSLCVVF